MLNIESSTFFENLRYILTMCAEEDDDDDGLSALIAVDDQTGVQSHNTGHLINCLRCLRTVVPPPADARFVPRI